MRSDILFQSSMNHIIIPPHPNPCGSQYKAVLRHRCQYYFSVIHQLLRGMLYPYIKMRNVNYFAGLNNKNN